MAWLGKLFGGTFGFMFGGPLGMIAGIAFGHMFDKAGDIGTQSQYSSDVHRSAYTTLDREQMLFFVGAFSMLARIASADGSVSSHERQKVVEFIRHDLRLGPREEEAAMKVFDAAITGGGTFDQFAAQFYQNFSHAPNILQLMIDIFYRVAAADGQINRSEEELIRRGAKIFRLPDSFVEMLCNRYGGCQNASDKAYAVLNVTRSATDDEIKRAFRKLSIEFHPDTLAAKGMGEEFLPHATKKFREIQQAYEAIKKERGIK